MTQILDSVWVGTQRETHLKALQNKIMGLKMKAENNASGKSLRGEQYF